MTTVTVGDLPFLPRWSTTPEEIDDRNTSYVNPTVAGCNGSYVSGVRWELPGAEPPFARREVD